MAGNHHHFPTFHRIVSATDRIRDGGVAYWIKQTFLTERGLLRMALYLLAILNFVHISTLITMNWGSPMPMMGMFPRNVGMGGLPDDAGIASRILKVTVPLFGPAASSSMFLLTLCLVGLAASARGPLDRPSVAKTPEAQEEISAVAEKPQAPGRHPLDPDPDDPPAKASWKRPSPS